MKKKMNIFIRLLSHINFIFSMLMIIFFIADRFNRAMAFFDNEYTKWLLFAFSITVLIQTLLMIIKSCRRREIR